MDFYVNFSLDENFDEVIKNKSKENFTYHSFSEGEKLRIDLAILFTWREISKMKNAANTNLLILDEILDSSLDALGIDDFLKILSSSKEQTNTFVISHRSDGIQDKFERIYRFSKVNGFTKISID
jgi:ABC-type multidrug transport system ATPase subunit